MFSPGERFVNCGDIFLWFYLHVLLQVFFAISIVETSTTDTTTDEKTTHGTTSDQKPIDGKTMNGTTPHESTTETSAISSTITTITTEATTRIAPVQWPNYHPIYRYCKWRFEEDNHPAKKLNLKASRHHIQQTKVDNCLYYTLHV